MATTINGVDFDKVGSDALAAAKSVIASNLPQVEDIVKNIAQALVNDVVFLEKKKALGEFNENDAKVFMEDQKVVARIRLRSVAIINLQLAERIWNAIADVFRTAINKAIGWMVL
ncbi:MAG TPA: hypothetical protein VH934_01380 [Xanthobacteraceae bacterium]|jgi:hypothetical protein